MAAKKKILTCRNGHWGKQIKGKRYFFGKDYDEAVKKYFKQKEYLESGVAVPGTDRKKTTLRELLNGFLAHRKKRLNAGSLSVRTYNDYVEVCDMIVDCLPKLMSIEDLRPDHFDELRVRLKVGKRGDVSLKSHDRRLGYARAVMLFASSDNRYIDRPLPFKESLSAISSREMRRYLADRPSRLIEAAEIREVLSIASVKMRAIILLSINGGFNNSDISQLSLSLFSPMPTVLVYPRRKTFFMRQTPLWKETKQAVSDWIEARPRAAGIPNLFLTDNGDPYRHDGKSNHISRNFKRLVDTCGFWKEGKNFGSLRTMFADVGKEVGDDTAVKALMGHSDGSMLYERYAKGVFLPRLQKVTDHVHDWLFPEL